MIEGLDEKYTNTGLYVTAFFDVMGIQDKAKENLKETLEQLWLINHFLRKEVYKEEIVLRTFSDNYFIAIKTSQNRLAKDFSRVSNIVGNLYSRCLRIYNVTLRGAITLGEMHIDDYTILGDALIKGHLMEKNEAVYPRILIDKSLGDVFEVQYRDFKQPLFKDNDSKICLNPLMFCDENMEVAFRTNLIHNLTSQLENVRNKDKGVQAKIEWVRNYVNDYYIQNHGISLILNKE